MQPHPGFEATSTNVFLDGYASALLSANSSHQLAAYAGASDPCSANQAPTTLSALGVLGGCTSTFLTSAVTFGFGDDEPDRQYRRQYTYALAAHSRYIPE